MKKIIVAVFSFFLLLNAALALVGPAPKVAKEEVERIEAEVNKTLEKEKVPEPKLFYLYLLGARNLRKFHLHDLAIKYYKKALELKVEYNENRLQGMLELAWLYVVVKKNDALVSFNKELRQYAQKQGFIKTIPSLAYTLDYFDVIASDKLVKEVLKDKDYTYFFNTNYNNMVIDRELEINMKRGNFEDAYDMFKFKKIDPQTYYHYLVSFDLLQIITKQDVQQLSCTPRAKGASGIEVDLCKELESIRSKKTNLSELKGLIARVEKKSELAFLLPAIKRVVDDQK